MWYYKYNQHLERVEGENKEAITIGSFWHLMCESYYKSIARNESRADAIEAAAGIDVRDHFCECGALKTAHITVGEYQKGACAEFKAAPLPLEEPVAQFVRDRFRIYTYTYGGRDVEVTNPDQVELGFSYPLLETLDRIYVLEGRIDLHKVTMSGNEIGFVDHKAQMRRRDLYKKTIQFRNYGLVTNATLGMINYARMAKTIDKDTFKRVLISFAPGEHAWWRSELIKVFDRVAETIRQSYDHEDFWWTDRSNPNWAMCSGKFGYECNFTRLCSGGNPTSERQQFFKIGKEWKPW
jgi:hypothetical protein